MNLPMESLIGMPRVSRISFAESTGGAYTGRLSFSAAVLSVSATVLSVSATVLSVKAAVLSVSAAVLSPVAAAVSVTVTESCANP